MLIKARERVDKMTYDITTLSLGAGVQSSTLAEMIAEGELTGVDVVLFADTGDEPAHVYEQVSYLRGRLATVDVPLYIVSAGDMVDDLYTGSRGRFAALPLFTKQLTKVEGFGRSAETYQVGRLRRQCTSEYKIEPLEKWIRQELHRRGLARRSKSGAITPKPGVRAQTILGISWDEIARMKPAQTTWIDHTWPLIDRRMTRANCITWLQTRGLRVPEKSSCKRCPYHDKAYFRRMRDETPDDWREVVQFDRDLRNGRLRLSVTVRGDVYLARECIPLDKVDLSTPEDHGQLDFCDEGYCFV